MTDSQEGKPEDASTAVNEKLDSSVRAVADEIEPLLQGLYANYICGRFPSIEDSLRQRLTSLMVLRRKRILYRRSRYGGSPIRAKKTISPPNVEPPRTQQQVPLALEAAEAAHLVNVMPAKSNIQPLAVSATTLAADEFKKASTPSVVSATKTVALGNDEDLVFPPAPNGQVKQRYRTLKKEREELHKAYLNSLPGFSHYEEYLRQQSLKPLTEPDNRRTADSFTELCHKISEAETMLETDLELDWNNCNKAIAEAICPFCLYALPSLSVSDEKKWKAHVMNDLDAYEDEGSESSEGEKGSSAASKPVSRTTSKNDPERYIKPTFEDPSGIQTWGSDGHDPCSSNPYTPWGGYRKYIASKKRGVLWHEDPSRDFVEESLFDGILKEDRRRFGWGFLTEAGDAQLESLENDLIIQSILIYTREKLDQTNSPSTQPKDSGLPVASGDCDTGKDGEKDGRREEGNHTETNSVAVSGGSKGKEKEPMRSTGSSIIPDDPVSRSGSNELGSNTTSTSIPDNDGRGSDDSDVNKPPLQRVHFYNLLDDAARLAMALKGDRSPPDTGTLIEILPGMTHEQLMDLRAEYKRWVKAGPEHKGVNVAKHIRVRLRDGDLSLMKACYATALGRWESEAYWASFWYQSDVTRRELLIEALMGRSNEEIRRIKDSYSDEKYDNSLIKCIKTESKEDKFKLLVKNDTKTLYKAMHAEKGGETAMIDIVVQRNAAHLREVLKLYEVEYKSNFARDALKKCANLVGEPLAHILNGVINKPVRDALLLHHALTASKSDELCRELLTLRLVCYHWDRGHMAAVKAALSPASRPGSRRRGQR
ncbi:hypothetical protein DL766_010476 [Monosporascus sp. MC13-8B]|uniref:Annexin n=1 Tax=Monosporascus cannonballus TaxID=155416 RepID=A0ABY0H1N3_9PEZI|nr:hypothetical protein DL762_008025 [Monosporascus cannonballus]RYP00368.1 hypothetical protein DL763_000834 [Monosporascus cannonballus]RYP02268.1 hypothetical protein DL766_010476 [Monosporascus sp. MC13-8B]